MRMSDIMSSMGLAIYPTIALVLFLAAFAAILVRALRRAEKPEMDRAACLPLADDNAAPAPENRP